MTNFEHALQILQDRKTAAEKKLKIMQEKLKQNESYCNILQKQKELAHCEICDEDFEEKFLQMESERLNVAKNLGCNFDEIYFCKICKDSGIVEGKKCRCLLELLRDLFYAQINIEKPLLHRFKDAEFSLFGQNEEEMRKLYSVFEKMSNGSFSQKYITLSGQTGCGKTFLAKCLANGLISNEFSVLFLSAYSIYELACNFFKTENGSRLLSALRTVDFLFIDDLGAEHKTDYYINFLLSILANRSECGKKTIFTTNCTRIDVLNNYGERIFSRIFDKNNSLYFVLRNQDLRIRM